MLNSYLRLSPRVFHGPDTTHDTDTILQTILRISVGFLQKKIILHHFSLGGVSFFHKVVLQIVHQYDALEQTTKHESETFRKSQNSGPKPKLRFCSKREQR